MLGRTRRSRVVA